MTWEWVTLILGILFLIVVFLSVIAWTQMNARIMESIPRTLPDLLARTQKEERE